MSQLQAPAGAQALQRLVMLTTVLSAAGSRGRPALQLAEQLGFGGTDESKRESLAREIRRLRSIGIEITNVADKGYESHYVLHPGDSRIRVAFDPGQRAQLARAALAADRGPVARVLADQQPAPGDAGTVMVTAPGAGEVLDRVMRAVTARCRLRFDYNGRDRVLDPVTLVSDPGGWTVVGLERHVGERRSFRISRMSRVRLGAPGSGARGAGDATRAGAGTDPLSWHVDPPITARVQADARYADDVARLLGAAAMAAETDGAVTYAHRVTNRWVFLARVIELGERVRLLGPEELRGELRDRLLAVLGTTP